jgi:hypothetical protein
MSTRFWVKMLLIGFLLGIALIATTAPAAGDRQALSSPYPVTPPDVSKISVDSPDDAGYALVTAVSGAVPPEAGVVIVNLDAHNVISTTADVNGGFQATLFAPPGSSLLVKYETNSQRIPLFWQMAVSAVADGTVDNLNPLPGAVLYVGGPEPAAGETQSFHTVGAFSSLAAPKEWAGWFMSGDLTVPERPGDWRLQVLPGDPVELTLHMRATSPALSCVEGFTQTLLINLELQEMFGGSGTAKPWEIWFDAFLFTPTGLPIEHEGYVPAIGVGEAMSFVNLRCLHSNVLAADLEAAFTIPEDLPEGYYRPTFMFNPQIALSDQVPQAVVWLHDAEVAKGLPILKVGDAAPPRIPWTLYGDELLNGGRGVAAAQDIQHHVMVNRVTTPTQAPVVPRLDARSGEPIVYHLEPGAAWLSNTDRRLAPPPHVPLQLPAGEMSVEIHRPDGQTDVLGPALIQQSSVRTPTTPGGAEIDVATGHIGDLYHLYNRDDAFAYAFGQEGWHVINLHGTVHDVFGNPYSLESTYEVMVAHVLDLDPALLPTTPFVVGDHFPAGLHVFPPVPAHVTIDLVHMPYSTGLITHTISGQANRFGYFQAPLGNAFRFDDPGEYRVDIRAEYHAPGGEVWFGSMTWGGVVAGSSPPLKAHGRRGMDYSSDTIDESMPPWFRNQDLFENYPHLLGTENYFPYFSGDIHWGDETPDQPFKGDSIHTILTFEDQTGDKRLYNLIRDHYPRATNGFRWPPLDISPAGLEQRLNIGEAPVFITTRTGQHPEAYPEEIDLWGYWYGSSQRPDVRVRELISEDNMGTAYWRFNDTYGYQIAEPADGDQPGDMKWEFGGIVLRTTSETDPVTEYAIYSSLWVLLPHGCDDFGCARVTAPFQGAAGGINGGPILTLDGQEIDMLFLPKGVRPGDVLELGDVIAFAGHVGPPLDSSVTVTVTAPSGVEHVGQWHANQIGTLYDPAFDFVAEQTGRWTVDVAVLHDRPYLPTGTTPEINNRGTVLGTTGRYEFYVVEPDAPRLFITSPEPGFITWPAGGIEPIAIQGVAPAGTTTLYYTIHDKGIVMDQGTVAPATGGFFTLIYDAEALHTRFPMLSLTAHEGIWEGLSDEVSIRLLALGSGPPRAASVTLIGEEVFVEVRQVYLPLVVRRSP